MKVITRPPARLAEAVSLAVANFAKKQKSVECDAWHQDEPVWYVHQRRINKQVEITKFVQVALFDEPGRTARSELAAIPGAQSVNETAGFGANLEPAPPVIRHVVSSSKGFDAADILSMIEKAWASLGEPTVADFEASPKVTLPQSGQR